MDKKIICIMSLFFLLCMPSLLPAELDSFNSKIIKVAFMNGFVRAVSSDLDKIEVMKMDREFLSAYLTRATIKYMSEVATLNKDSLQNVSHKEKENAFTSKGVW